MWEILDKLLSTGTKELDASEEESWFVGAQSENGGGVAGVMLGARKVARRVLQEQPDPPQ